nr:hypothetical protein OG296_43410 [Streptomyces sp. NBC_01001]
MGTVIGREQAESVFNRYVSERTASLDRRDSTGLGAVETGPLLAESLARIEALKLRGIDAPEFSFGRAEVFLPAEREQQAYPRSFVVVSRAPSDSVNVTRDAALHYFVQDVPGGDWKAVALSWVNDKAATPGKSESKNQTLFGYDVRDKEIAAITRDAGAVKLSPTAAADREACGRYAQYMTFTAPSGVPENENFFPGKLTSEMVKAYNVDHEELDLVRKRYAFEVTGGELPVLRLADGKSLVTCSFVRTDQWAGNDAKFRYGNTKLGDVRARLGENVWWERATVKRSVTATFEVSPNAPADVVGCNCLTAPLLSAEGDPA